MEIHSNVSLALSGSGFKFPAHLGGIKAIEDYGRTITEIAGVSGGAIVAGLYSCGLSLDDLTKSMMVKNWIPYYKFNPFNFISRGGLVGGEDIEQYLLELTKGKTFSQTNIPLTIITTNLASGEEYVFSKHTTPDATVAKAIRASISIPGIFCPVRIGDNVLVDGVVINSLPIHHLRETEGVTKIGIKLLHTGSEHGPHVLKDMPDSIRLAVDVIKQSIFVMADKHDEWVFTNGYVDNVIRVPTQYADPLDPSIPKADRMRLFKDCYLETKSFLDACTFLDQEPVRS